MKSQRLYLKALLFWSITLLISCQSDELETLSTERVEEGLPAYVQLQISPSEAMSRSQGLNPSEESKLVNLYILIFNSNGLKVGYKAVSGPITDTYTVPAFWTQSGNNMKVYAVANLTTAYTGTTAVSDIFTSISTLDQFKALKINAVGGDAETNRFIPKFGMNESVTIAPTNSLSTPTDITIPLNYLMSKIRINVIAKLTTPTDEVSLVDWKLTDFPKKSYIYPNTTDAGDVSDPTSFGSSQTAFAWNDTTLVISGVSTPAKTTVVYLFENRRGTITNTNPALKPQLKPAKSTALVARGYYKYTAQNRVVGLQANVYLGQNATNDYNVVRGLSNTFLITVKGVKQYSVSSTPDYRLDSINTGFQVDLYNTTLDAHYDYRPLRISAWKATAKIEILESDGVTPATDSFWLKVSNKNLYKFVNNGSGTYVRPTYNPTTDLVTKIENIDFPDLGTMSSQMFYIYADENVYGGATRSAKVKVTNYEDPNNPFTITYTVTQNTISLMGNVGLRYMSNTGAIQTANDSILGMETIYETYLNITPGASPGSEKTNNMQWGFNQMSIQPGTASNTGLRAYYQRAGKDNTYLMTHDALGNLRAPFGRISAATSGATSATISESVHNPIYNTYPARYCLEKNRDLDGNGKIDQAEIKWFLPSIDEYYMMWVGSTAFTTPLSATNYWASTEFISSFTQATTLAYDSGASSPDSKTNTRPVVCVRRMKKPDTPTTPNSPYVETSSLIINNTKFNAAGVRTAPLSIPTPAQGYNSTTNTKLPKRMQVAKVDCKLSGTTGASTMTWAEAVGWTTVANSTSTTVAASPATGCNAYSENPDASDKGTWRIPTQKELYIILLMNPELAANSSYTPLQINQYWMSTPFGSGAAWYMLVYNYMFGPSSGKTALYYVRCIKELT